MNCEKCGKKVKHLKKDITKENLICIDCFDDQEQEEILGELELTYNPAECTRCSVCNVLLLPDDECYTDIETGDPCCTEHCYMGMDDNYHKISSVEHFKIKCNMCEGLYNENDLERIQIGDARNTEAMDACPKCKTDKYLMDL